LITRYSQALHYIGLIFADKIKKNKKGTSRDFQMDGVLTEKTRHKL